MKRTITIDYGESRHVRLNVFSCKNEEFEITNATYSLTKQQALEPEDSGSATILDHVIDVVINPKNEGFYNLKFSYSIADENLVDIVEVFVKGD